MCNVHEFVLHCKLLYPLSLPFCPFISAFSVPPVFVCRLLLCPAVGRGTGRPRGSATATHTRKPILMLGRWSLTLGRRLQMIRYTLYDVQAPYLRNRDLSDQAIFEAFCSRDDSRDGIEGPVTSHYSQESVDSKWPTPKDAALPQPGSLSTPQSSWQTYTERATQDDRGYVVVTCLGHLTNL